MNSHDTQCLFNELNKDNHIFCTKTELNDFILNGFLLQANNNYYDRAGNKITIELFKKENMKFNLDFTNLIQIASELSYKKVYYMSETSYNKLKAEGLILTKNNKEFYRFFDNDLWLVYKI